MIALLCIILFAEIVFGYEVRIKNTDDFLVFVENVNSGITYSKTTVFLDSDLSLTGYTMNSIGISSSNQFRGVFDGQGYVISNLNINSSSLYAGLFNYSGGLTIRNVILDSSCSITNTYNDSSWVYVGGIIGYCRAYYGRCIIDNIVNMASVTFNGPISYILFLGGIAGDVSSYSYKSTVENCANYGSVTHSGTNYRSFIGGIVGYLSDSCVYIYNSLNYGSIIHNGTTSNSLFIGGIAGCAKCVYIENCVSAGMISSSDVGSNNTYIGSLIGKADYGTHIDYCYYTNDVNVSILYNASSSSLPNTLNTPNSPSNVNSTLIKNLNTQVSINKWSGWNKWLFNKNNKNISFKVKNSIGFSISSQIILIPVPEDKDNKILLAVGISVSLFVTLIVVITVVVLVVHKKKSKPQNSNTYVKVNNIMKGNNIINNYNNINKENELGTAKESTKKNVANINSTNNIKFQNEQTHSRFVVPIVNNTEYTATGMTLNSLYKRYPSNFVRPTLKQALLKAKLNESQANDIVEACVNAGQIAEDEGKLSRVFTKDDAAAVSMYTYDFGEENFESNPYRIINKSLADRDYNKIQSASGMLYLIMTALRKLPRVTGKILYRGVREDVSLDDDHYRIGNIVTWSALSSTSPDMNAIQAFLAKGSKSGKASGTMFFIENGWGYDIQPYSLFPNESEILLEPERQFKVTGVIEADLTIIKLEMLDTPLCLPNVFGREEENEKIPVINTNNFNLNKRIN